MLDEGAGVVVVGVVVVAPAPVPDVPPAGELPPVLGETLPLVLLLVLVLEEVVDVELWRPRAPLVALAVGGVGELMVGTMSPGAPLVLDEAPPLPPHALSASAVASPARSSAMGERCLIRLLRRASVSTGERSHRLAAPGAALEVPLGELVTPLAEAQILK